MYKFIYISKILRLFGRYSERKDIAMFQVSVMNSLAARQIVLFLWFLTIFHDQSWPYGRIYIEEISYQQNIQFTLEIHIHLYVFVWFALGRH